MDLALTIIALVGGLLLGSWWVKRLREDLTRRQGRAADWDGMEGHGQLWTSAARCPRCQATGALLSREDDGLWHTCMSCGHRHRREHRG